MDQLGRCLSFEGNHYSSRMRGCINIFEQSIPFCLMVLTSLWTSATLESNLFRCNLCSLYFDFYFVNLYVIKKQFLLGYFHDFP
jgi:hypothetical protein